MTQTPNFQLNQWSGTDYVCRTDFNADNLKIDAAIKANADAISGAGNCVIETGTYTGTGLYGESNPVTLTFQHTPQIVFLNLQEAAHYNSVPEYYILLRGTAGVTAYGASSTMPVSWEGKTVSWRGENAQQQMNKEGVTYRYMALCTI